MLGQRGVFGSTLDKLAVDNVRILALSADLKNTSGLDRFAANHPDRFVNVGIAEQNLIGVAAGLADSGYNVFVTTFANFAALRACEFVRHFMGYMQSPVKLVGFAAGYAMEYFGNTHYGVEDIAALRSISNLTIISPADGLETAKSVTAILEHNSPVYLRLTGMANMPVVYRKDYDFQIGRAVALNGGTDIALISVGSMVANALEAAKLLMGHGISSSVVNMHTIKPLDTEMIDSLLDMKLLVSIEEHNTIGGLGSAIADYVSEKRCAPPMLKLGVSQGYKKAGSYRYMLEQNGLLPRQIVTSVISGIKEKGV
jgi:transketolase